MDNTVPVIEAKDVCFGYKSDEVLHNVTFSIPARAHVAVVGPNGGGKTTLLRLILGILKPRFGSISVFGRPPSAVRKRIGIVPQVVAANDAFPISVLEAVMTGCSGMRIFGGFSAEDRQKAETALRTVGMYDHSDCRFSSLSGGQKQRVIIARAISSNPDLLILDEPTANVDSATRDTLYALFKKLSETKTVVTVSHNLGIVMSHATHVLCVNRTVDIHDLSQTDCRTVLESIPGHSALSVVHPADPAHMEELSEMLKMPHRGI